MESPEYWNRLTAAFSVVGLADLPRALRFARRVGLVSDAANEEEFVALATAEIARGEITGPSMSSRVAHATIGAGLATDAAREPDPYGKATRPHLVGFDATVVPSS